MNPEPELSEATEAPPSSPARKGKKILWLVLAGVLLGAGGLSYLFFSDDPGLPDAGQAASASATEKVILPLEPFLINLADRDARRYLKLKVELELAQEKSAKELEKCLPPIRDALILLLSSKAYADISTPEGKGQLKTDILQRLAAIPGGRKVKAIYFTEFVAQ
jgi:flagellar FliL protein|uniref:Flagellar protein FliL n=1 Tax=Desulfobacca acetoxidans TaxID=60893 RepID=A0A7C5EU66_9BACT